MTEKSTNDDNDGCNDNYGGEGCNLDNYDDTNDQKRNTMTFEEKITISDYYLVKSARKFGHG